MCQKETDLSQVQEDQRVKIKYIYQQKLLMPSPSQVHVSLQSNMCVNWLLQNQIFYIKVVDAMFKDIWHPENPARLFIGNTVVSYSSIDNVSSTDPISTILPGYTPDRVDALLQGPIDNENETLYIFLGKKRSCKANTFS